MTLTEFLLDRIEEDKAEAAAAHYEGQVWVAEEEAVMLLSHGDFEPTFILDRKRDASHAARWSPARVLAECEAKRRIVAMWEARDDDHPVTAAHRTGLGLAIKALATVYADHLDYDEAWRP